MQLYKKGLVAVAVVSGAMTFSAGSAYAGHDHFVVTPNGNCHQVARGQTAISNPAQGGYHQYHEHVHFGATRGPGAPVELGDGHSVVAVYKDFCPTAP